MNLRPCSCGCTPAPVESERYRIQIIRMTCKCGKTGATMYYTKPADRERMLQAAADGWNMAD